MQKAIEIQAPNHSPKKVSDDLGITVKMVRYFCRKKDFSNKHNIMYLEDYEKTK